MAKRMCLTISLLLGTCERVNIKRYRFYEFEQSMENSFASSRCHLCQIMLGSNEFCISPFSAHPLRWCTLPQQSNYLHWINSALGKMKEYDFEA